MHLTDLKIVERFHRFFRTSHNEHRSPDTRGANKLRMEILEERALLSVSPSCTCHADTDKMDTEVSAEYCVFPVAPDEILNQEKELMSDNPDGGILENTTSSLLPSSSKSSEIQSLLHEMGQDPSNLSMDFIFNLNSNENATHLIYLDFDGHTTTNTDWNNMFGRNTIITPAFNLTGTSSSFSNSELMAIFEIWLQVSEDYMPFDINVTTSAPTTAQLARSSNTDSRYGIRCAIGGSCDDWFNQGAGGVAFLNSYGNSDLAPCYIFTAQTGSNPTNISMAISHEVGHTLGLSHDGLGNEEYHPGSNNWGPIMGAPYGCTLQQWSRGNYTNSTNTEDDLRIITTRNGFSYRDDDHGNTRGSATFLTLEESGKIASGIIEQNTDRDYFSIELDGGDNEFTVSGLTGISNLDIQVQVYDSDGELLSTYSPVNSMNVTFSTDGLMGTHYFMVSGTGKENVYSNYGSLGAYNITVKVDPTNRLQSPTLTLTVQGTDTIRADWSIPQNTSSYVLQWSNYASFPASSTTGTLAITDTNFTVTSLDPNTTYYFRVYAVDDTKKYFHSNWSDVAFITTDALTPEIPSVSALSISHEQINVTITPNTQSPWYNLEYSTSADFSQSVTTLENLEAGEHEITGLQASTTYYFRTQSREYGYYKESAWSIPTSMVTHMAPPPAPDPIILNTPVITSATVVDNTMIHLDFTGVENADGYTIQYSTSSTFLLGLNTLEVTSAGLTRILNLNADTTYYFRVRAEGSGDYADSGWSETVSASTAPNPLAPAPVLQGAEALSTQSIQLRYTRVSNATRYIIQYSTSPDFLQENTLTTYSTASTATINWLTDATTYYFRVQADGTGMYSDSAWSNVLSETTLSLPKALTPPIIISAHGISQSEISVAFTAVPNAVGYIVQYTTMEGWWPNAWAVETLTAEPITITDLWQDTTYYIRVYALGDGITNLDSDYSAVASAETLPTPTPLASPVITNITPISNRSASIIFTGTQDADSFTVQYSTDPLFSSDVFSIPNVQPGKVEISGLAANSTYYIRVTAIGSGLWSNSAPSNVVHFTTGNFENLLDAPVLNAGEITSTSITVTWAEIPHATSYVLQYSNSPNFSSGISVITGISDTKYTVTELSPKVAYYFRVLAVGNDFMGDSVFSNIFPINTAPDIIKLGLPSITGLSSTSNSVTVKWLVNEHASSYTVECSQDASFQGIGSTLHKLENLTGSSATLTQLDSNSTYYIRIKAVGKDAYGDSDYSMLHYVVTQGASIPLMAPGITSVSEDNARITVQWNEIPSSMRYVMEYKNILSNEWTSITTTRTTASFNGEENVTYQVRVYAVATPNSQNINSGYSAVSTISVSAFYAYHENDLRQLQTFMALSGNGKIINAAYDPANPNTFTGVTWSVIGEQYRVTSINWDGLTLSGTLNLSGCSELKTLYCRGSESGNQGNISDILLTGCTSLTALSCGNNALTSLDVTPCVHLTYLSCSRNRLSEIIISESSQLTSLDCASNSLNSLDVSHLSQLTTLNCSVNNISQLDITNNLNLRLLTLWNSTLESVIISNHLRGTLTLDMQRFTYMGTSMLTNYAWKDVSDSTLYTGNRYMPANYPTYCEIYETNSLVYSQRISFMADNSSPEAENDEVQTFLNIPVMINALENDSDVDGDTLSITSFSTPAGGTIELMPGSRFLYTPNEMFLGNDSFTYTISDSHGHSDTATVSISVNPLSGPAQIVTGSQNLFTISGNQIRLPILYSTTDSSENLTGLTLRVHYDSQILTFNPLESQWFTPGTYSASPIQVFSDVNDYDSDLSTDSYLQISWVDMNAQWPGMESAELISALFQINENVAENTTTVINYTAKETTVGYGFLSIPTTVHITQANLDIDGDGYVNLLTDAALFQRYLAGYTGSALTEKAVSPDAVRSTPDDIMAYLDEFGLSVFDLDGDGTLAPETDAILFERYLAGFSGNELLHEAVALNATRSSAEEIIAYIQTQTPNNDALRTKNGDFGSGVKPEQLIYTSQDTLSASPGAQISVPVMYTTSDMNAELTGLVLSIYYNSNILTPELSDSTWFSYSVVKSGSQAFLTYEDTFNSDGDTSTDAFLMISWADWQAAAWPGNIPEQLLNVIFTVNTDAEAGTSTMIHFSGTPAPGYVFQSTPSTVNISSFTPVISLSGTPENTQNIPDSVSYVNEWENIWLQCWSESASVLSAGESTLFTISYNPALYTPSAEHSAPEGITLTYNTLDITETDNKAFLNVTITASNAFTPSEWATEFWGAILFTPASSSSTIPAAQTEISASMWISEVGTSTRLFSVPYDLDDSGNIALADLAIFAASYGNVPLTPIQNACDYDKNGIINLTDLSIFSSYYNISSANFKKIAIPSAPSRIISPIQDVLFAQKDDIFTQETEVLSSPNKTVQNLSSPSTITLEPSQDMALVRKIASFTVFGMEEDDWRLME